MRHQNHFFTKEEHIVCVNLTPNYYLYLTRLAQRKFHDDIPKTINYLISKHIRKLYSRSKSQTKRTLTAEYQPTTKNYKRYWISIEPVIWGRLFQLRLCLGYSMSYLLRMLLDFEIMKELRERGNSELQENQTEQEIVIYHNYDDRVAVDCLSGRVFFDFYDDVFLLQ
ncbi:MAG: DUF1564 family protein [Leptospiraceae bacterium]|nr:DUF1564 family protein [Leptospiraceae bacterium]